MRRWPEVIPGLQPPAVSRSTPVQRWRAWLPVAKSAALFVLPFPILIAILAAMIAGDARRLALTAGALVCFWGAATLTCGALVSEARYLTGDSPELPVLPGKLVSLVLTAGGAALAATAGGQTFATAGILAALGAAGHRCFYGADLRPHRVEVTEVAGVDVTAVRSQIEGAYQRLRRIDSSARAIAVPEFRQRLDRISEIGRTILRELERDPRQAGRARRFLNVYLDSTEQVTREYARTHQRLQSASLEQSFRQLLIDMETTFSRQHQRLLEDEALSLDVDIEVLNTRLKREIDSLEARP